MHSSVSQRDTRVRLSPDVTVTVTTDGRMRLVCARTGVCHAYTPAATAMWIALQQHDGRSDLAASALARLWDANPESTRFKLDACLNDLLAAGFIQVGG